MSDISVVAELETELALEKEANQELRDIISHARHANGLTTITGIGIDALARIMIDWFYASGAKNYVTSKISADCKEWELTIQLAGQKTATDTIQELREELWRVYQTLCTSDVEVQDKRTKEHLGRIPILLEPPVEEKMKTKMDDVMHDRIKDLTNALSKQASKNAALSDAIQYMATKIAGLKHKIKRMSSYIAKIKAEGNPPTINSEEDGA